MSASPPERAARALRRLPVASAGPIVAFAIIRLALAAAAIAAVVALGLPYEGRLLALLAAVALPWTLAQLVLARRAPRLAVSPLLVIVDFALLAGIEAVGPDTYAVVRFLALFLVAAHSHLQGEQLGLAVSATGVAIVLAAGAASDGPVGGDLLLLYELVFAASALATSVVVGRLRTSESLARLRARGLTRRAVEAEDEVRRRVAAVIHDGPVQELASLELILEGAARAARRGDGERVRELLVEAKELAGRNMRTLRDEIVALGPQAYDELSFASAVELAIPVWRRRFGIAVRLDCDPLELPSEVEGDLFRIAQEAVVNAGRHARATTVTIALHRTEGWLELCVVDDGRGFREAALPAPREAGHLGLASMRERAEALGGRLRIRSGAGGTEVRVRVPFAD